MQDSRTIDAPNRPLELITTHDGLRDPTHAGDTSPAPCAERPNSDPVDDQTADSDSELLRSRASFDDRRGFVEIERGELLADPENVHVELRRAGAELPDQVVLV